MKKTLALALLLSATFVSAFAQRSTRYPSVRRDTEPTGIRIGLKAGVNFSNPIVSPEPFNFMKGRTDFHAGVFAEMPISERFAIQPELLYSRQGFSLGGNDLGSVNLHYLSLPILAKINLAGGLSLLAGPQVSYLTNARVGVLNNLFSVSYDGAFQKIDASLVAGLQYDLPGGLTLGGRYTYGLNNINKDFDFNEQTSFNDYFRLRNAVAQVSIGYKF